MAVASVIEQWQGRGATTDEKGVRTLKRAWLVTTDSASTGEPAVIDGVIAADATAALFASHPSWPFAVCRSLTAAPHEGPTTWQVEASYSSAPFEATGDGSGTGSGGPGDPENPTSPNPAQSQATPADQRPPTISVGRKEVTEPLVEDAVTGKPVVNAPIGDPFNPPPEVFRSRHVITWKFFRAPAQLNWSARAQFLDSVNGANFVVLGKTYPPRTLRCVEYSIETVWETSAGGLALFFALTVQAEERPETWDVEVLNAGRRKKIDGSVADPSNPPRVVFITDDAGQPVADPVPLDELSGHVIEPPGPYDYLSFFGYVSRDWSTILG